jgi:hypothetical protein
MQSTTHSNEQMQYTFQPQSMVQNHKDQNGTWTSVVLDQSQEISSPKLVLLTEGGMLQEVYNPSLCISLHF